MDWRPTELAEAVAQGAKAVLEAEPTGWAALIEAGLLDFDDVLADVALLTEVGATGAFVPAFETLCLGWPAREAAGRDVVLTGILEGDLTVTDGRLTGTAHGVPCADRAQQVVVAASGGVWLATLADATVEAGVATNEDPAYSLTFDGAAVSPHRPYPERFRVHSCSDRAPRPPSSRCLPCSVSCRGAAGAQWRRGAD